MTARKLMIDGRKQCPRCREWKAPDEFGIRSRHHTGLSDHCKACSSIFARECYQRNRRKRLAKIKAYVQTVEGHAKALLHSARTRARAKGCAFTISPLLLIPRLACYVCEATGLPLTAPRQGGRHSFAASLDRIDNNQGYTEANTRVVSEMYNRGKGFAPELDFIAMCIAVAERHADNAAAYTRLKELRNAEF